MSLGWVTKMILSGDGLLDLASVNQPDH